MTSSKSRPKITDPSLQRELGLTIGEISRAWRFQMNRRLKPFGLNLSTRQVLLQLHRNPEGLMQNELARRLGIEGPTLVRLLDHLERKAWIKRLTAEHDKRRKYAVLTPMADSQIRIIEELSAELRATMMHGLNEAELAACLKTMQAIRDRLTANDKAIAKKITGKQ
jgi:MarR family transcriptional regulator, transcriptional regulator for hemolysin